MGASDVCCVAHALMVAHTSLCNAVPSHMCVLYCTVLYAVQMPLLAYELFVRGFKV